MRASKSPSRTTSIFFSRSAVISSPPSKRGGGAGAGRTGGTNQRGQIDVGILLQMIAQEGEFDPQRPFDQQHVDRLGLDAQTKRLRVVGGRPFAGRRFEPSREDEIADFVGREIHRRRNVGVAGRQFDRFAMQHVAAALDEQRHGQSRPAIFLDQQLYRHAVVDPHALGRRDRRQGQVERVVLVAMLAKSEGEDRQRIFVERHRVGPRGACLARR